uniref:G_PROTEIN_RECEP_F1_2 domain-containing protein n=1 Tax=Mesocestoides corti TaxID=53468 RepID=A0A5K3F3N2_MESCO
MLWYCTVVCVIIATTAKVLLQQNRPMFLNYVCMPLDITSLITIPKVVVVFINFILSSHYLRMKTHRYLDEWFGSLLYTIGDIIDLIFGLLKMIDFSSDADQSDFRFISRYVLNRTITCFMCTLYQTFFKMSLMKFYHRFFLITMCHGRLKTVADNETSSPFFQLINTFSEYETSKDLQSRISYSRS